MIRLPWPKDLGKNAALHEESTRIYNPALLPRLAKSAAGPTALLRPV